MADVENIEVNGTKYSIADIVARVAQDVMQEIVGDPDVLPNKNKDICTNISTLNSSLDNINTKLSTFKVFEFRTVRLTYTSASQLRNDNVDVPSGYSLENAIVLPSGYNGITIKMTRPIMRVATTGLIALGDGFTSSDVIELRVLYFK